MPWTSRTEAHGQPGRESLAQSRTRMLVPSAALTWLRMDGMEAGYASIEPRTLVPRVIREDNRYDGALKDAPPGV